MIKLTSIKLLQTTDLINHPYFFITISASQQLKNRLLICATDSI